MSEHFNRTAVKKVMEALEACGHPHPVVALESTARSAQDAADALGCELGAIVKTLVFATQGEEGLTPIICLVAGDRRCAKAAVKAALQLERKVSTPGADFVKQATGYTIGGVSPAGLPKGVPVLIDPSLARFETLWAAAGHPYCVFQTSFQELQAICGGLSVEGLGE